MAVNPFAFGPQQDQQDYLGLTPNFGNPPDQNFAPLTQAALPTAVLPTGKGKQLKENAKSVQDAKSGQTRTVFQDAPQYQQNLDTVSQSPEFQAQKQGVEDQANMLSMLKNAPVNDNSFWVKPLLALADAQTGSKLSGSYTPPESYRDRLGTVATLQNELQKNRGQLSKDEIDALKTLKAGQDTQNQSNQMTQQLGYISGQLSGLNQMNPQEKMDFMAHQRNIQAIKKDPVIIQNMKNSNQIASALNNASGVDTMTPEQFHELQQSIRQSITKGSGGVGEREQTYYNSLGIKGADLQQFITGTPSDLSTKNPFVQHVLQIANLEMKNLGAQSKAAALRASGGNASVYARRPDYQADLDQLLDASNQASQPAITPAGLPEPTAKGGKYSGPTTVSPSGNKPHPQDTVAVQWAKANPTDPRAAAIMKANGG